MSLLYCCIFVLAANSLTIADDLVVSTKNGKLQGFPIQTTESHKANIYLGVPYAAPPTGNLRFEKPAKPLHWDGVRNASEFPAQCIPHDRSAAGEHYSEDCLYLNIITPSYDMNLENTEFMDSFQTDGAIKSAVMIWIHGGAYSVGSSSMYGYIGIVNNFVSRDVIVVTIQYRLGPYGFLTDGSSEFAGNYGLWDQLAAIIYVKENIAAFGGDPKRITLFGSSAGGGSVSAHTLSPHSRDLFFGSISLSGSVLAPWASGDEVIEASKKLANELHCSAKTATAMKKCLRTKTPDEIFDAVAKTDQSRYGFNIAMFAPRVDGDFFTKNFTELAEEAPMKPTIIGLVENEAAFFTVEGNIPSIHQFYINSADWETFGEKEVIAFIENVVAPFSVFGRKTYAIRKKIISQYLGTNIPETKDYKFYLHRYTELISDAMFNIPCVRLKEMLKKNGWPVWFYFNIHYNPTAYKRDLPIKGATHLDEYPYLFDITPYKYFELDNDDRIVQRAILETFTNFAKYGTPSTDEFVWEPVKEASSLSHFQFSTKPGMRNTFLQDRIRFWQELQAEGYDIIGRRCETCGAVRDEL